MTVSELMEKLADMPPDAEVVVKAVDMNDRPVYAMAECVGWYGSGSAAEQFVQISNIDDKGD